MDHTSNANLGSRLAQFVLKYRWLVILAVLAFAFALAFGLSRFGMDNDYRVFFSKENPQLKAFDALQAKYTKDDNIYIIIDPKDSKVFDRRVLMAMEELVDSCWQTPYSSRVDALTNYQHTVAEEDDMYVNSLISNISERSDEEIRAAEKIALSEVLLKDRLINC